MTLVAIWREDSLWASMPAVGILLPQAFWMADFLGSMIGLPLSGMTAYMFDSNIPLFTRGLSFFHFWLPLFLIWILWRLGYDRRAWRAWTVLAWGLMTVCYFLMPGPSESLSKAGVPVNINYVYGMSDTEPQQAMPPLAYLGLLLVALPLAVYLPTHLVLRSVFRPCATPLSATDAGQTAEHPVNAKRKRRWFQYRLRTLLMLMLVFGAGLGWLTHKIQWARAQRNATAAIEGLGGTVMPARLFRPDGVLPWEAVAWMGGSLSGADDVVQVDLSEGTKVSNAELVHLLATTRLARLNLANTQVSDAGLVHLQGLKKLKALSLNNTRVSDAGLVHLQGLTQLWELALDSTQVSDAGLAHVRGLTELKELYLSNTRVTDAGLTHLQGLTQLTTLSLAGTQVSDAGLVQLRGLTQLQRLYLRNTHVTDAGLAHLQGLTQLATLDLAHTQVSDAGLANLQGLTGIQWLYLNNTQVGDAGLVHLKGMTALWDLDLSNTRVSDAGLVHLQGLKMLHCLYLNDTRVSDAGLVHLQGLTICLERLYLANTQVSGAGIDELRRTLRRNGLNRNCEFRPSGEGN